MYCILLITVYCNSKSIATNPVRLRGGRAVQVVDFGISGKLRRGGSSPISATMSSTSVGNDVGASIGINFSGGGVASVVFGGAAREE